MMIVAANLVMSTIIKAFLVELFNINFDILDLSDSRLKKSAQNFRINSFERNLILQIAS